jgi:glycosyltransferase involved in cell wall biosynthesis
MLKILFLTPWYPSEKDAMSGLFVQKHVEAVRAQGCDVRVIFSDTWCDTWRQWCALRREGWMPDVVQLNVIQKQGLLALYLKKRYGIPYVIVEHWTGYLAENPVVQPRGWHTRFMKRLCSEAEVVMPVSRQLIGAMQALGFTAKRWEKINNVVDDFFFEKAESRKPKAESRESRAESQEL